MNSNEPVNYGEIFCDAVDAIVSQRLADLKYDITKICTIIDNTQKALGKYTVKEEVLQYDAYSVNTTFEIGDSVIVLIPNGDYDSQKTILNKIVSSNDLTSSITYVSPLKSMINFIPNGIINDNQSFSILANDEKVQSKLLYTIDWQEYKNYKKIGISAKFQSWLKNLNTVSGDYGLKFVFYNKENSENNNTRSEFLFNTNDILGNPYNFPTYFTQEKVIDISHLLNVNTLEIYFYQNNDFRDENGFRIISQYDDNIKMLDNLFIKDIKLYAGYDISEYNDDKIILTTSSSLDYSSTNNNNDKELSLHWVHKIDTNNYEVIDNTNIKDKEIKVYWVCYDITKSDSTISDIVGSNWVSDENLIVDSLNAFKCILKLTEENKLIFKENIRIKAVCRILDDAGNWESYESDILTFTSKDKKIDQTTYNAVMGLSLSCLDNSFGNYFIYDQNNELIDESQGRGRIRTIQLLYNGKPLLDTDSEIRNDIDNITWTLPNNITDKSPYTMLNYYSLQDDSSTSLIYEGKEKTELLYTISNYWYSNASNNTINCEVTLKNGEIYKTSKELLFGKANSQGTNLNLILQYSDTNKNAYEVITDNNNIIIEQPEKVEISALLYNLSGQLITSGLEQDSDLVDNDEDRFTLEWNFDLINNDRNGFIIIGENDQKSNKRKIQLQLSVNEALPETIYSILKAECTYKIGQTESVQIVSAYLPIAIKTKQEINSPRCETMSGARKIIYNTMGYPNYYTDEYALFSEGESIKGIQWELHSGNQEEKGYPELKSTTSTINISGGYALSAKPIFIQDNEYKVCVVGKQDKTIYWIQPLLIMQSAYDFAIINKWNGTQTLADGTSIVTSMVAVGNKNNNNNDNTFSGIVLGDIKEADTSISTGLYGISNGIVTFQLTDKGQATFMDKDNDVNVLFGTTNKISTTDTETSGMFIFDFDEKYIQLSRQKFENTGLYLSRPADITKSYLTMNMENGNQTLLDFKPDSLIIQSPDFNATSGLQFDVKSGIIKLPGANYISGLVDNNYDKLLKIGNLIINNNGEIYIGEKTLETYIQELIENANKES